MVSFQYSVHGDCIIEVNNNIVYINVVGPWNYEFFTQMHEELLEKTADIKSDKIATFLRVRGQAIAVDSAYQYHMNFIKNSRASVISICLEGCETTPITKDFLGKLYRDAGVKYEFFNNEPEAIEWLKQEQLQGI